MKNMKNNNVKIMWKNNMWKIIIMKIMNNNNNNE